MRIMKIGFLVFLGLVFLINIGSSKSQGTFYYVALNGSDTNPGNEDHPWRTIQKAAQTLTAGDTVYIKSGIYNERVVPQNSGTAGSYITYSAFPGAKPVIDGGGVSVPSDAGLFHVSNKNYIIITGLKVQNVKNTDNSNGILVYNSSYITVKNNHTYDTRSSGISVWDSQNITLTGNEVELACNDGEQECITVAGTTNFTVSNNQVHNSGPGSFGGEGIDAKDGSSLGNVYGNYVHHINRLGIYIDAWDKSTKDINVYNNFVSNCKEGGFAVAAEAGGLLENIKIYNNVAYNNDLVGVTIAGWGEPGYQHPMQNIYVINNTIYNNGGTTWGGGISVENSEVQGLVIRNNIFSWNHSFQIVIDVTVQNLSVDHNLIHGFRSYSNEIYGSDYVTGDPLFVNIALPDFHLQKNSPAIDKGSSLLAPANDLEGGSRPIGSGFDIGAYEFRSAKNDFNGDGQGDILWRHYGNGANALWYLQSTGSTAGFRQRNLQALTLKPGPNPAQTYQDVWEAAEILYKDERVYHDVLEVDAPQEKIEAKVYRDALEAGPVFYRPGTKGIAGDIQMLMMPGDHEAGVQALSILSTAYLNTISTTSWHIEATGDLNGDGNVDILWRHYSSGQNAVWYMNGSVISGTAYLTTITDTLWRIEGTGDFNGDGNTDLLWRHYGTGKNALWYMSGTTIIGTTYLGAITDTNWRIEATGDFNGDGDTDFVWRNYGSGQNAVWYMSGSTHSGTVFLTAVADVYWAIAGAGDFNQDGNTDLLWRHYTTGSNSVWYMSGTTITGTEALTAVSDLNWRIENH